MTQPQQGSPLVDTGNPLISQVPARMDTGTIDAPGVGLLAVLTFRTASTTMTVMLTADDLKNWAELLTGLAGQMNGGGHIVQATPVDIAALARADRAEQRNGKRRR